MQIRNKELSSASQSSVEIIVYQYLIYIADYTLHNQKRRKSADFESARNS